MHLFYCYLIVRPAFKILLLEMANILCKLPTQDSKFPMGYAASLCTTLMSARLAWISRHLAAGSMHVSQPALLLLP